MKRVNDIINRESNHYLYPFFWQKGQDIDTLKEYLDKMNEQGIYNCCIESRPHPEFLKEGWWETMDFLVAEAKKRSMHLWILDDAKFPTGFANGCVSDDLKKCYLQCHRFDVVGFDDDIEMNFNMLAGFREMHNPLRKEDTFVKAILVEQKEEKLVEDSAVDVSKYVQDNILRIHLDNKHYSIFALYQTRVTKDKGTQEYLDPMRKEATQILINEVYEKHYAHYKDEFGSVITAFFSDEPHFGNSDSRVEIIGENMDTLPINKEVVRLLDAKGVKDYEWYYLFAGKGERARMVRFTYMDIVSGLYRDNFSRYIGEWCAKHNVKYVGHVIEDDNTHARLGQGPGHYFRAMAGEDVAGIDVIGGQVVPGMDYHHDAFSRGGSDGEFYHYMLCNMGRSAAKLDVKKNGTLMCEAFGAYGWVEGLKMMKWISDHLIAHGVNLIVPHAFDPAPFPDWDCPPHFYAHGMNPQYPYFHVLTDYLDNLCHLFSGGYMPTSVGVLYHAFAEWSGDTMLDQRVLKELATHQIPCDVIGEDYLDNIQIEANTYRINSYAYDVLIVPKCTLLPDALQQSLNRMAKEVCVLYVDEKPVKAIGEVITLETLHEKLAAYRCVELSHDEKKLSVYPYLQEDGKAYMFFNEDVNTSVDVDVKLDGNEYAILNVMEHRLEKLDYKNETFHLHLDPYESLVVVKGVGNMGTLTLGNMVQELRVADSLVMEEYRGGEPKRLEQVELQSLAKEHTMFAGTLTYTFNCTCDKSDMALVLPKVYEVVEVKVNGHSCGVKMAPNYIFDVESALQVGNNTIEVVVVNNLSRALRDMFSVYLPLEPLGITKPIQLVRKVLV